MKLKLCMLSTALACAGLASAQTGHLPEVTIEGPRDASIGSADSASEGAAERESYQSRPKLRPGDIVEAVPGVVATQHSGDGKGNQYFLRGFNLDHGTDFAITVDGMPVNMPSHGHGQGFADLNFLIPELVSGVRYRKGPYALDNGDFSLAGSASMDYFSALDKPFGELTLGGNGYRRALLAGSRTQDDRTWLAALELMHNDGPWVRPEDLKKVNAVLRYSQGTSQRGWRITGMAYDSDWSSTDQIPMRAVDSGALPRFGTLDPTDGGSTRRVSLSGQWFESGPNGSTEISAYAIDYSFDLFSDFTYFLSNPVQGDQFEQTDRRRIHGAQATHRMPNRVAGLDGLLSIGASWRGDRVGEVGLYLTESRNRYATVREDSVSQDLLSVFAQQLVNFNSRWRAYAGLRGDSMRYRVSGHEPVFGAVNSGKGNDTLISPKAGLAWTFSPTSEFYANAGTGFHSNDVRGATITLDPQTGLPAERVPALVQGRGAELGWRFAPSAETTFTLALWRLNIDSELVYIGDAGATEAGRASTRRGIEAALRWKPAGNWRVELEGAVSHARFKGQAPAGEGNYIDNAVETVLAAGVTWTEGPWTATARLRHMGARALDTLNTERSKPSTLVNAGIRYAISRDVSLGLDIFNLTNRKSNDIEYFYASCTAEEVAGGCNGGAGFDDRHVHPMEPRTARLSLKVSF
ncbi:TonB-dependent receptor [Variovorax sp. VNK109]|uniref:TonB-dependent receptor n=1 Tax=Variovorax sp. VNK109 TaxID=3400919 RepID=UPI003BFE96FC